MTIDYAELLAPLTRRKEALLNARQDMQDAIAATNAELQQIDRMLKAGGLIEEPPKRKRTEKKLNEVNVSAVEDYIRAHYENGDGFFARGLMEEMQMSSYSMYPALDALAERGIIRLDHIGKGGKKTFKLVSA